MQGKLKDFSLILLKYDGIIYITTSQTVQIPTILGILFEAMSSNSQCRAADI